MLIPNEVAQRVEERAATLGLARTLAQLSPRQTITPLALAEAGLLLAADANNAQEAAPPGPALTATADLPRISLDQRPAPRDAFVQTTDAAADLFVMRTLGEGGMGRVLLARQRSLGRDVAVKVLKDDAVSASLISGLLREARIMGSLEHPGIVPVHALGLDDAGLPLLVMKRIEGVTFRALLDDTSHPTWSAVSAGRVDRLEISIEILIRVCEALSFAHSHGVVHRDIKPDNIMVGNYGEVYLCDWGVAAPPEEAASPDGTLVGTPLYMAPEMLFGTPVDARTDVYLLGATLHEVLTGRPRHEGANIMQILHAAALSAPVVYEASVPSDLAEVCNRATSCEPAQRPESADVFRRVLSEYLHYRNAMVWCETALERVNQLEAMLSTLPSDAIPDDLALAYRLATEARFGLTQSLRVKPLLEPAKRGLERTVLSLVDIELRQKNLESAAALLEELTTRPPALVARLVSARADVERQRLEVKALRAIAREHDPSVGANSRLLGIAALGISALIIVVWSLVNASVDNITNADISLYAVFMVLSCIGVFTALRRQLLETLFNRRVASILTFGCAMLLVHRLLGWRAGQTVASIVADDTLLLVGMLSVGAFTFERRLGVVALALMSLRGLMDLYPERASRLFSVAGLMMVALFLWIWRGSEKKKVIDE